MGLAASHSTEGRRQEHQTRLDALKTAAERNKWGQFATPNALALSIARYAREQAGEGPVSFLDPAIGTGSFYSALRHTFAPEAIRAATGVELDPLFAESAEDLWGESGLTIVRGDFTDQEPPSERFNLVLTNPPYVRHHHLPGPEKNRLKTRLAQSLNMEISGLAGLYCYFVLLCHDWMEDQGLAIWLIPSEFMDVNYGSTLRRYLSERVTLLHIHRFCPTDVQFTDALVSSAVVVFRKSMPPAGHRIRFSFAGPIDSPQSEAFIPVDVLRRSHKWTQFPASTTVENTDELRLGDIFTIKRGLATGSNSFFIMTEADTKSWEIPHRFLKPILPARVMSLPTSSRPLRTGPPPFPPGSTCWIATNLKRKLRRSGRGSTNICSMAGLRMCTVPISPVTAIRGIRRNSAHPRHSFAPTWDAPETVSIRSVSSGIARRQLPTMCI